MPDPNPSQWPKQLSIVGSCLLILAVHVWVASTKCDWTIVQRSGTIIVFMGLLLEYWPVIRTARADNMAFFGTQAGHTATRVAIGIVCSGTLLQGYGDHFGRLFLKCT